MSDQLEQAIAEAKAGPGVGFYLLWGEEFLVRKGADELVRNLLTPDLIGLNYSVLDGVSPREVAQDLATLPLFPGRKVVLVRDPEFLAPKKGRGDPLRKAREAWRSGKRKEGARRLLALAARAGWGVRELDPSHRSSPSVEDWKGELGVELAEADVAFLKEVAEFCREEEISAPESDATPLLELFEKGLPEGQVLVIAATDVDSKSPLLKLAKDEGCLIERKVSARLKDLDLTEFVAETLRPFKKRLSRTAEDALKDRCGGNMRLIQSELEKLALFAESATIEAADVHLLVKRARDDEFFELSEALQRRDFGAALKYVENAIAQGSHPLQLLGALASAIRTMLLHHDRLVRLAGGTAPRSYDAFGRLLPRIEREATEAGQKMPHPYALFMGMQAAARYHRAELLVALRGCADADLDMKSSGNGKLILERILWTLTAPAQGKGVRASNG